MEPFCASATRLECCERLSPSWAAGPPNIKPDLMCCAVACQVPLWPLQRCRQLTAEGRPDIAKGSHKTHREIPTLGWSRCPPHPPHSLSLPLSPHTTSQGLLPPSLPSRDSQSVCGAVHDPTKRGRFMQCFLYMRSQPQDNHYAHPLDLVVNLELHSRRIMDCFMHPHPPPIPRRNCNFAAALVNQAPPSAVKLPDFAGQALGVGCSTWLCRLCGCRRYSSTASNLALCMGQACPEVLSSGANAQHPRVFCTRPRP